MDAELATRDQAGLGTAHSEIARREIELLDVSDFDPDRLGELPASVLAIAVRRAVRERVHPVPIYATYVENPGEDRKVDQVPPRPAPGRRA